MDSGREGENEDLDQRLAQRFLRAVSNIHENSELRPLNSDNNAADVFFLICLL